MTAQLINAADGYHLWSERYDRELTDVFAVQDEIATAIASALQVTLAEKTAPARIPNLAAYEAVLKGRHHMLKHSPGGFARANACFDSDGAGSAILGAPCEPGLELLPPGDVRAAVRAETMS